MAATSTKEVIDMVDIVIAHLSHEDAKDYLERLSTEIEVRIDGIKDDIKNAASETR